MNSKVNASIFYKVYAGSVLLLLLYVDDIIIIGSDTWLIFDLMQQLHNVFALKDLGDLSYFLGIQVTWWDGVLHLWQEKYVSKLLHHVGMSECKPISTPIGSAARLSLYDGELLSDPTEYRSLVGAL